MDDRTSEEADTRDSDDDEIDSSSFHALPPLRRPLGSASARRALIDAARDEADERDVGLLELRSVSR